MVALVHDVNVVSAKKDGAVDFDAMCTIIVIDAHVILIIIIIIAIVIVMFIIIILLAAYHTTPSYPCHALLSHGT